MGGVPKNILGEEKGGEVIFGGCSVQSYMDAACMKESVVPSVTGTPPNLGLGGERETKISPIKENLNCSDGEKMPSGSCPRCAPGSEVLELRGEAW